MIITQVLLGTAPTVEERLSTMQHNGSQLYAVVRWLRALEKLRIGAVI